MARVSSYDIDGSDRLKVIDSSGFELGGVVDVVELAALKGRTSENSLDDMYHFRHSGIKTRVRDILGWVRHEWPEWAEAVLHSWRACMEPETFNFVDTYRGAPGATARDHGNERPDR